MATWTAAQLPWVLVVVVGAYGVVVRIWLLAHMALFGDEAVVGLMGRGVLNGHFGAFYWGSHYGGAEPYVVAAVLGWVNGGPTGLNATPALLAAAAALLVYAVLATSRVDRRLAALGAAAVWVWPYAATWNSVREIGFRGALLCCGLLMILCALRAQQSRAGPTTWLLLGLAGGVGWWASPEIVYFVLPTLILLVAGWGRLYGIRSASRWFSLRRLAPLVLTPIGLVVGSLPWLYANIRSGFASVSVGSPPPPGFGYGSRLSLFFNDVLPTQLGLRGVPNGGWIGGTSLGRVLYGVVAVLLVLLLIRVAWMARRGRRAAPLLAAGAGLLTFPFLATLFPTSWYQVDGRYGVYLAPLLVLTVIWALPPTALAPAVTPPRHATRRTRRVPAPVRLALASVLVVAGALSTVALGHESAGIPTHPRAFFSGWTDPNALARQVITAMVTHHIRYAYGDYWTAYTLDFLAPHAVTISPSPLDLQRSTQVAAAVRKAKQPAWLFFSPHQVLAASVAFSNPEPGPGGYTEAGFLRLLALHGITYRIVPLGVLTAVIPTTPLHLHLPHTG
jgi:hypothetical protein